MLSWIREKFGTVVIGSIIAFIAFVFIFYGVFSPKSTRGLHEGAVAGTVNGDPISIGEFNRELNRRMEFFKSIGGGKITDEQLKAFRIKEGVFQELANRKILIQEAQRHELVASDEEIREKIQEIPAFQKEGKFSVTAYKQVLEANNYTPASFERLVREDSSAQRWEHYFQDRVSVSEGELKKEFMNSQDQRNLKYVLLTSDSAKKNVSVSNDEAKKFLEDTSKVNLAKQKYEEGKGGLYKGQKFDDVKEAIAKSILAAGRLEEIQKVNDELAEKVLQAWAKSPTNDAPVNAVLKASGVQVKATGMVSKNQFSLPGLGDVRGILADAFAEKSAINPKLGGKAKKYSLPGRTVVAWVSEVKTPDLTQFPAAKEGLMKQLLGKKTRELYQEWMKKVTAKAQIDMNPAVVGNTD